MTLRVLIGDHQPPARARTRAAVEADERFAACAEAASAAEAIGYALHRRPQIALLEVRMPGGGIAAAREIAQRLPNTSVVMLTTSEAEEDVFAALRAGVSAYLLKSMNMNRLPHALWDVHQGAVAMPRALLTCVFSQFHEASPSRRRTVGGSEPALTAREWQILQLLEAGVTTAAIAQRLSISAATVRSHHRRIAQKLRQQAASYSRSLPGFRGAGHVPSSSGVRG